MKDSTRSTHLGLRGLATIAVAVGAVAVGASAIAVLAIGRLAIRRLSVFGQADRFVESGSTLALKMVRFWQQVHFEFSGG